MPAITPEPIMKIATGFMAAKFLFVANEIGLFEALASGPASLEEIANRIAVPSRTTGIVAAAMVSLGLIEQEEGRYRNSAAVAAFLVGKPTLNLRPMLQYYDSISYPLWQKLSEAVRLDEGRASFAKFDQAQQHIYSAGVEAFTAPVAAALPIAYDFSRHRRLLDVAGGTGSFLVAVLRCWPALRGTLFELPQTCAVAREHLAQEPERTRIEIVEGDVFKVSLPGDHDIVLVANAVHMFSVEHNLELLRKIRAAAQAGTRLLLVDLWTDPTHSDPAAAALMSGAFLLTSGEGQTYSEHEADKWLQQTGWRKRKRTMLAGASSLIVAEAI
jgi:ubiquinone/menaquinone biosynthesis C-methylase UbiE